MKQLKYLTVVLGAAIAVSCTKLEETQRDSVNFQRATAAGLLQGAYNSWVAFKLKTLYGH